MCIRDSAVFDGERTILPRDVHPREAMDVWMNIRAPAEPGTYVLHLSLVQEAIGWFDERGGEATTHTVSVVA